MSITTSAEHTTLVLQKVYALNFLTLIYYNISKFLNKVKLLLYGFKKTFLTF